VASKTEIDALHQLHKTDHEACKKKVSEELSLTTKVSNWLRPGQSPATRRAARRSHFSSFPFFSGFCFRNPGFFRTISGDGAQTTCRCEETEEEKTKISKTTGFFKKKLKTRATSDAARRASRAKTRPESGDEKQARRDARRWRDVARQLARRRATTRDELRSSAIFLLFFHCFLL